MLSLDLKAFQGYGNMLLTFYLYFYSEQHLLSLPISRKNLRNINNFRKFNVTIIAIFRLRSNEFEASVVIPEGTNRRNSKRNVFSQITIFIDTFFVVEGFPFHHSFRILMIEECLLFEKINFQ